jgi:hypothetical protein
MNGNSNMSRSTGAFVLIGLGVVFLLAQIFDFSFWGALWPLIVMIPGLAFLYFAYNGDKGASGLIFPGAIITGTGAILLYQNLTNHWESWAYAWTLYPVFVGMGLVFMGRRTHNEGQYKTGQGMIRWGAIAFAGFWVLFELLIFGGDRIFGNWLLPVVLIGVGVLLLLRRGESVPVKRKVGGDVYYETKPKKGTRSYSDELQAKIDAALAEPDADEPTPQPTSDDRPSDPRLN